LFLALVPWAARASTQLPSELDRIPIYLLVDLSSGQTLVENEADRRFVPASITKVMTAFTAFEMIKDGEINQNQRLSIRPETFLEWRRKGSTMFLPVDAEVSVEQLLRGITTVSANDASIVLAEGASGSVENWIAQMNTNARRLGMRNSHFGTPNGWPDEGRTFVSARDLVALGSALIEHHPDLYERYFGTQELTFGGITQPNHNPLLGEVEGADGIKTGFTNQAGFGLLGAAQRNGRRLVMVVAGAQSSRDRGRAARALIEWGFTAFESRPLNAAVLERLSARVQNGSSSQLRLRPKPPFSVTVPAGKDPAITLELQYDGPLRAPIMAGTNAAKLEISVEGMPTSRIPLFADQDVEKASFLRRIWNGIIGWFT
jgi:D-alanyl-D-alanine carboxypeptidase (penicillin-binding protein 5/6)